MHNIVGNSSQNMIHMMSIGVQTYQTFHTSWSPFLSLVQYNFRIVSMNLIQFRAGWPEMQPYQWNSQNDLQITQISMNVYHLTIGIGTEPLSISYIEVVNLRKNAAQHTPGEVNDVAKCTDQGSLAILMNAAGTADEVSLKNTGAPHCAHMWEKNCSMQKEPGGPMSCRAHDICLLAPQKCWKDVTVSAADFWLQYLSACKCWF